MFVFDPVRYEERVRWFKEARFGMFIHFGLYAIPARGEWVRSVEQLSVDQYEPYFRSFNPVNFDARSWAKTAKDAGMKYVVLTAKHHDGFCLFDSQYTDYKITNTPFQRDLIKEYVEAFRAEGLRVGLYYSLLDWHHPDYPHFGDRNHPMRNHPECSNEHRHFENYVEYFHNQVRELCTNYGKLDLLWFDFSYDDMTGEKWEASKLVEMVRSLQPDVMIDNRLEVSGQGFGSLYECRPTAFHGDFVTPECMIPPSGLQDVSGKDLCWESCITMNNNWGYARDDHHFKPASLLIKKLVECVSKGGNMLLNVGPMATGEFPKESVEILKEIGDWMHRNSESIHGCGKAFISDPDSPLNKLDTENSSESSSKKKLLSKPDCGRYTANGSAVYLHVFENSIGPLPIPEIKKDQIESVTRLYDGAEVNVSNSWVHSDYPDVCFLDLGDDPNLPDPIDTVLKIQLRG